MNKKYLIELRELKRIARDLVVSVRKLERKQLKKNKGGFDLNKKGQIGINMFVTAIILISLMLAFIPIMDAMVNNVMADVMGATSYSATILTIFRLLPLLMTLFIVVGIISYAQRPRQDYG